MARDSYAKSHLRRFLGHASEPSFSVDELQGLLLQVSFAIMMVFMIAYFLFRSQATREADEQVMALQKQKLVTALETIERRYETRYGLTTLLKVEETGAVSYDASAFIEKGHLTASPLLREAFSQGAQMAHADYADMLALRRDWWSSVLGQAELEETELEAENRQWLNDKIDETVLELRRNLEAVQLFSAVLLQRYWMGDPSLIKDPSVVDLLTRFQQADEAGRLLLATDLATALRRYALAYLGQEAGTPMLIQ